MLRELNPGPLAPEARIMPLDRAASWLRAHLLIYGPMHAKKRISAKHPELFLSLRRLLKVSHQHYDIERPGAVKYTRPGSNWRPSACEADVIATRPQVLGCGTCAIPTNKKSLCASGSSDQICPHWGAPILVFFFLIKKKNTKISF